MRSIHARARRGRTRGLSALALFALASPMPAAAETVWFVVAERQTEHDDSYLLPLSDPTAISQARARIAQGNASGVGSIAVVNIAAGSDGINRDVRAQGTPLWSWHVSGFQGFADVTIELCDGWPGLIEQNVAAFIANTNGTACFWGYTVVAELQQAPAFAINEALDGAWYNPQTSGQGLMLDVLSASGQIFVAWFTYAEAAVGAKAVGDPGHRWLTALGPYGANTATLGVTLTRGGAFNDGRQVQNTPAGTLTLSFEDCNHGQATFALTGGPTGGFPIRRVVPLATCGSH